MSQEERDYVLQFPVTVDNVEEWLHAMADVIDEEWYGTYEGRHRSPEL